MVEGGDRLSHPGPNEFVCAQGRRNKNPKNEKKKKKNKKQNKESLGVRYEFGRPNILSTQTNRVNY